ncbi:MAG: hypothetical protein IPO70_04385 [Bacteroidetes bacterium]|nr:hypothetical protein [Bacteroidota bacterium]
MELSIVQQNERENEKRLKLLDIIEIIDLYFSTFNYLLYSLRFLLSNSIERFEENLKSADFTVSIESLCMRLEIELLRNPNEYNEKLFNVISIRINDFERLLSNDTASADYEYEKLKSTKIKFQVEYYQNLNTAKFNFVYDAIQNERGTIETFYNAILNHFNYGKERINNLFSLKNFQF